MRKAASQRCWGWFIDCPVRKSCNIGTDYKEETIKNKKLAVKILSAVFALTALAMPLAGCSDLTPEEYITREEFNQIKAVMTYQEVKDIVGSAGSIVAESTVAGYTTVIVSWDGDPANIGSNANVTFQNGVVVGKAQAGLK